MLPRIVYIGGHGRSGSTILEYALHQIPGIIALGEFRQVFDRGLRKNELCACGVPFRECGFWTSVFQTGELLPIWEDPEGILSLQFRVDRPDRVLKTPLLLPSFVRGARRQDVVRLGSVLHAALERTAHLACADAVVDSSKVPSYGGLLAKVFHDRMALVHVIRDPRAVAFSLQRRRRRPEVTDREEMMPIYAPARTAVRWCLVNLLTENLGRRFPTALRVRYEDFATAPHEVARRLIHGLDLPGDPDATLGGLRAPQKPYHSVSGNPVRFAKGPIEIRLDTEWKQRIDPTAARRVTMLTLPLLLRYGYPVNFGQG